MSQPARALRARVWASRPTISWSAASACSRGRSASRPWPGPWRAPRQLPQLRLLLVGPVPDRAELETLLARRGVLSRTARRGPRALQELPAHIEAADVVVHLRYPTARETSAALLRLLAQGRPTVISDLEHLADIPATPWSVPT